MALYRVEITTADGERDTVTVEADNVRDAREKARAGAETGSTVGLPVLEAAPTRAARPTVGAGDVGEEEGGAGRAFSYVPPTPTTVGPVESYIDPTEWGDAIPSTTAPPGRMSFRDFTQSIDPDLIDPRSSSYVPPPVTTAPPVVTQPPTTPPSMWSTDQWGNYVPPPPIATGPTIGPIGGGFGSTDQAGGFGAVPTAPAPPITSVGPIGGGGFGPTDQAGGMGVPPAFVPPAAVPPAAAALPPGAAWPISPGSAQPGDVVPLPSAPAAAAPTETVINPATGLPVLTSQELINDPYGYTREAGRRLALRNVFGQQALGQGPLAGYLQRQLDPLQSAFRAEAFADMARGFGQDQPLALAGQGGTAQGPPQYPYGSPALAGGGTTVDDLGGTSLQDFQAAQAAAEVGGTAAPATGVAAMPGYSFEDFLRTTRGQDTGLGGAYGQALQNVGYLRGLGQGGVPPALAGILSPETSQGTWDARNLLGAAQKGRYSGLVSRSFRQPSEQDLFADYVLARQDATAGELAPQNFLNFAASRYGL